MLFFQTFFVNNFSMKQRNVIIQGHDLDNIYQDQW